MNSHDLQQSSKKLELHQQRAADLRASMVLLELGAGIRVDDPIEALVVDTQQTRDGAA